MNIRELALTLLDEYELLGKYVNLSLSSHKTDGITGEERGFLTVLLYTAVERKLTYDYIISSLAKRPTEKIDTHTLNILRLGLCQLLDMESVADHVAVNETVKLGRNKGERGFVNGILRATVRARDGEGVPMPDRRKNAARYLSVAYSFPLWIVKHFIATLGEEETERLLSYYNSSDYTDLTVNTQRIKREDLKELLQKEDYNVFESSRSPLTLRISGAVNPTRLKGFAEGRFFVQDEICAVSIAALDPREGDVIVDVCACPGGKSFAAAILSKDKGEVYAFDLHESKLSLITDGAERLGFSSVRASVQDATSPKAELFDRVDRLICDVPCSGLGILGKKPDIRYRDVEGVKELPALQYSILKESAKYLKCGGVMIYSTCTLNKEENEAVVERFLSEHKDFTAQDFKIGDLASTGGMLTTLPHVHKTDGFFIAKLQKV